MVDYKTLIDDEMWAYIHKLDSSYPPDAVAFSVEEQRAFYDRMCAMFRAPRPANVVSVDETYGGVACRRYEADVESDVTVVYYHGGGFVVGGLESQDDVCAEICSRTGYGVISVDYGLAPETVFPGIFEDSCAAFEAVRQKWSGHLLLCGDSAGGNLAAAVMQFARGRSGRMPVGQVLIYPGLGGDITKGSYVTHANAPHLTVRDLKFYETVRTGGKPIPERDPRFRPLQDTDFSGLPPTLVVTAECDPLSSDGETYRDAIRAAGGKAEWIEVKGMVHACLRARNMSRRAAGFFDHAVQGIAALGKQEWPY